MELYSEIAKLRIEEDEAIEAANEIVVPYNKRISSLEAEIGRLKTEQQIASYEAWGKVQSIRRKIWQINEQITQERYEEATG